MATELGDMFVKVQADITQLKASTDQIQGEMVKTGEVGKVASLAMAGVVVAVAMQVVNTIIQVGEEFYRVTIEAGEKYAGFIAQVQAQTDVGVKSVQELSTALAIGGLSESQISMMIGRYEIFVSGVEGCSKKYVQAMHDMGLNTQQFLSMSKEDQFNALMKGIAGIGDAATRSEVSQMAFGRSSYEMALILKQYPDLLNMAQESMKHFGMTQPQIDALEKAGTDTKLLSTDAQLLGDKIGGQLAPQMDGLVLALIKFVEHIADWLAKNPQMIKDIGEIIDKITSLITVLDQSADAIMAVIQLLEQLYKNSPVSPFGMPQIPDWMFPKGAAEGGIFNSPQVRTIGEAGPEAVIPLSKMGGMGGTNVTIQAGAFMGSREDARNFARMLQEIMRNENNTRTYGRLV